MSLCIHLSLLYDKRNVVRVKSSLILSICPATDISA